MSGPMMFNDPPVRTEAMITLFRTAQRRLLLLTGATAVLGVLVGLLVAQVPGVWGALMAAGLGLVFTFTTLAVLRWLTGRGPELLQIVLIGTWVLKMVLTVLLMLWLRDQTFYHRGVFFGTLVVVVLGAVVVEIWSVGTARIPAVEAQPSHVTSVTPHSQGQAGATTSADEPRDLADGEPGRPSESPREERGERR